LLEIDVRFAGILAAAGLRTQKAIVQRFARGIEPGGRNATVRPDRIVLPDGGQIAVHYKHYEYRRPAWRFVGRRSKAHREFLNYQVFARVGLRTPETLAWGEARSLGGRLRYAFIVTRTIPNALTLIEFWEHLARHPSREIAAAQRAALVRQLAEETRRLHAAQFVHNDLVWRNLLVTWEPPADAVLWWIDCPRGGFVRFRPLRWRRQIKDLALLDRQGVLRCTPRERLAFLRYYLGASSRDPRVAGLGRAVIRYARRRWPDR
jgi:hypothetical protein